MSALRVTYVKTEAGVREVAARSLRLPANLRRLLILIDGERDAAQLANLLGADAVAAQLAELEAAGLIMNPSAPPGQQARRRAGGRSLGAAACPRADVRQRNAPPRPAWQDPCARDRVGREPRRTPVPECPVAHGDACLTRRSSGGGFAVGFPAQDAGAGLIQSTADGRRRPTRQGAAAGPLGGRRERGGR